MTVGERLQVIRKHFDLSQEGISEAIGIKRRGYQENESDRSLPGAKMLQGLIELGVNVNWVLSEKGPMLLADLEQGVQDEAGKYEMQEPASIDLELLEMCSGVVSELMEEFNYNIPEHKRIRLVGILYEYQRLDDAETGESCRTQAKQLLSLVS